MGTMFLGGPPLVEAATGEIVTAEELGGAALHTSVSGCADYFAADEEESSQYIRDIVETLNIPASPTNKTKPVEPMAEFDLLEIAGQKVDARLVLSCEWGWEIIRLLWSRCLISLSQSHFYSKFAKL